MYAFLTLFVVLVVLYAAIQLTESKKLDGFENDASLKIPYEWIPTPVTLSPGSSSEVVPSNLPGPLPEAPYQQVARNSPYPYRQPSLQRTTRSRILDVLATLQGFLGFQAQEIDNNSDPSIQLPLQTARGDFGRLNSEAGVLQRNPGLTPSLTELDMSQIQDNLAYLQREVELLGVNRPFQSSAHDLDLEGFIGTQKKKKPTEGFQASMFPEVDGSDMDASTFDMAATPPSANQPTQFIQQPASEKELQDFSARIQGEIMRLSSSGTTDPVITARVGNLTKMKTSIDEIVSQLQSGALLPLEVPIHSADIEKALPILANPSEPLPQLLRGLQLPAGLANMLPASITKSTVAQNQLGSILQRYAQSFLDGASASMTFNVNYANPNTNTNTNTSPLSPLGSGIQNQSSIALTGFPSSRDLDNVAADPSLLDIDAPERTTDPYAADPRAEGRAPVAPDFGAGSFDWKGRALQIIGQIKKRGMNPKDFGALYSSELANAINTSQTPFSWKGYTKMICTRLMATDVNKMDEMCGCPPATWKGWN
jgi:hypothetical protein